MGKKNFNKSAKEFFANFDIQFEGLLKTASKEERKYINENYDMLRMKLLVQ